MTTTTLPDCQSYLDNNNLCILEILSSPEIDGFGMKSSHWLLLDKVTLSVHRLELKYKDGSSSVQERFFDLGYLKYTAEEGIFIEPGNRGQHLLSAKDCRHVPETYLNTVALFMRAC